MTRAFVPWSGSVTDSLATYRRDPLPLLERAFRAEGDVFRLPWGQLCVADPALAREILRGGDGRFREHSDFFAIRRGTFGPRSAQLEIDRRCRLLLDRHHAAAVAALPAVVERELVPRSEWPDAGNRLLLAHAGDALLAPGTAPGLRATLERVVDRAVLAGARERRSKVARALFRRAVTRELAAAVEHRRSRPAASPRDLLDVVAAAAPRDAPAADLAEVFLGFVFALVGSVGFVLGWAVHLLGTHPEAARAEPGDVVREALRLWPVAWLFERTAARDHRLGGESVRAGEAVLVCSYLAHRHPAHWTDPTEFQPRRWAAATSPAYLPFGWGPHSCAGAGTAVRMVEDALRVLTGRYELAVEPLQAGPQVGPALAPPRFRLRLSRRADPVGDEGR